MKKVMKKNKVKSGKLIWAVSPSAQNENLQFVTFQALAKLTEHAGSPIEPVAVLSPEERKIPLSAFKSQTKKYQLEAAQTIEAWSKKLKNPRLLPPTLLVEDVYSSHISADVMLRYAKKSKASLIALGTHNRKGLMRFFFGSFAETLMLKSDIPLLLVNPRSPAIKKVSTILFPTDFSASSRAVLQTLLPTAKANSAKIILYYKFEYIVPQAADMFFYVPEYDKHFAADLEHRKHAAEQWVAMGKTAGVKIEAVLDKKSSFTSESILRFAKKFKVDMIAMASQSGSIAATLMGSVARQVVRGAHCPVWVIHPPKIKGA